MIKNLITKQNETNDKKTSFECQFNVDYAIPEREGKSQKSLKYRWLFIGISTFGSFINWSDLELIDL